MASPLPGQGFSLSYPTPSSTALKWGEDGELSPLDLEQILARLVAADPVAQQLGASQFSQSQQTAP
jgi:hypothetical protein